MTDRVPIIGIRGDMGHGKDTLAEAIRDCFPEYSIRKFATKLREAVRDLTGMPVESMVSDEDKKASLTHMRWSAEEVQRRLTLAITTVAGDVDDADALRWAAEFYAILAEQDPDAEQGPDAESHRFAAEHDMTVGRLLQLLGTDCFRAIVDKDIWVKSLLVPWARTGRAPVIVADTRFPNESAAIRKAGGVVILVRRESAARADGRSTRHASERALDGEAPDLVLDNNGSIADLRAAFLAAWPGLLAVSAARPS